MKILVVLIFLLTSCADNKEYKTYLLDDNREVHCRIVNVNECGLMLLDCIDGRNYQCQQNVETL